MLLLDTHTFLWYLNADLRLPDSTRERIQTSEKVYISIASFWEMAIKCSLGKLELPFPITKIMEDCASLDFEILHINSAHLEAVQHLPWIHRDPFDRLLIAQAQCDDLTLETEDMYIPQYDVKSIWD